MKLQKLLRHAAKIASHPDDNEWLPRKALQLLPNATVVLCMPGPPLRYLFDVFISQLSHVRILMLLLGADIPGLGLLKLTLCCFELSGEEEAAACVSLRRRSV